MRAPTYFAVIPADVRYSDKLTPSEKLMYGEISVLSNSRGFCDAKNSYFAELYSTSERSITVWLKDLEINNFIYTVFENGKRRIYIKSGSSFFKSEREIIDVINQRQSEKYLGFKAIKETPIWNLIVRTVAKAYFTNEFIGKWISGFKVNEKTIEILVEVFDAGKLGSLFKELEDRSQEIMSLDYYIFASVLKNHSALIEFKLRQSRHFASFEERLNKKPR